MRTTGLEADVEMAGSHASHHAPVVVASVQTLMPEQRRSLAGRAITSASLWWMKRITRSQTPISARCATLIRTPFVLGVTATPDRSDKRTLSAYYENVAFEITLLDLIKQGDPSPITVKTVPLEIDLDEVRTVAGTIAPMTSGTLWNPT